MAAILDTVRPGDVISSELLMRIIGLLNEHDALLSGGGTGGGGSTGQLITGTNPPTEQNVNRTLTVFGNFDFPLATNALSIDNTPISPSAFLPGSNNLQLVFRIPTTISIPQSGRKPVIIRIVNTKGSDQRPYTLLAEVPGLPDPVINGVVDSGNGSTTLRSEMEATISGLNLASPFSSNQITFTLNPGPAQRQVTLPAKSGSVIQVAPLVSTLLVDMPVLTDPDGIAVGDSAPGTLSVTVPGTSAPAVIGISIERQR